MKSIKEVLSVRDPKKGKYSKNEFQVFGYYLATNLEDTAHTSLYIKLSKDVDRNLLEKALAFVKDSKARSKGKLFMWKLKELRQQNKTKQTKPEELNPV